MVDEEQEPIAPARQGLQWNDVVMALLRRKWWIVACSVLGVAMAYYYQAKDIPRFESKASLWVFYAAEPVSTDGTTQPSMRPMDNRGLTMLNNERVVLNSWGLAEQTARSFLESDDGLGQMMPLESMTRRIERGLRVSTLRDSTTMTVSFADSDRTLPQPILRHVLTNYMVQHLEKHRASVSMKELESDIEKAREKLEERETKLRDRKRAANVLDVEDELAALRMQIRSLRNSLSQVETSIVESEARIRDVEGGVAGPVTGVETDRAPAVDPAVTARYRDLMERLSFEQGNRRELLGPRRLTSEHKLAVAADERMAKLEEEKVLMEEEHPGLLAMGVALRAESSAGPTFTFDLAGERRNLLSARARQENLNEQLAKAQADAERLDAASNEILSLGREVKELTATLDHLQATYDRERTTGLHAPGSSLPNISVVDWPTPPSGVGSTASRKSMLAVAVGVALGIGLALLLDLVIDQMVRRPADVEKRLGVPLMITLPRMAGVNDFSYELVGPLAMLPGPKPKAKPGKKPADPKVMILPSLIGGGSNGSVPPPAPDSEDHEGNGENATPAQETAPVLRPARAPWDVRHALRPYFEATRDRLTLFFQLRNMNHKPKLVAVAGCTPGAGTSTLAAGLAAALSETGDGNVLLVDMNLGRGAVHPFFQGRPSLALAEMFEPERRSESKIRDRLYLASAEQTGSTEEMRPLPKRLSSLMPKMKASDYDFIIFDMPPISEASVTVTLSATMDKVLLVIEADKTHRGEVVRAYEALTQYNPNVMGVLNKHRAQAPRWLQSVE